uniref:Cyclic nucleotide-binding domain-containing protein n=1 Tax=Noctiluca scintillans TaxID=2966 RepID=A0A7S1AEY5_NOCSC|mmetsp:Transcript_43461/g.114600  ORF Transcript_43461/g.114600 Transcript_43461/m.114600 type:complete len:831 (+) Transcript_43461:57-2549(+)
MNAEIFEVFLRSQFDTLCNNIVAEHHRVLGRTLTRLEAKCTAFEIENSDLRKRLQSGSFEVTPMQSASVFPCLLTGNAGYQEFDKRFEGSFDCGQQTGEDSALIHYGKQPDFFRRALTLDARGRYPDSLALVPLQPGPLVPSLLPSRVPSRLPSRVPSLKPSQISSQTAHHSPTELDQVLPGTCTADEMETVRLATEVVDDRSELSHERESTPAWLALHLHRESSEVSALSGSTSTKTEESGRIVPKKSLVSRFQLLEVWDRVRDGALSSATARKTRSAKSLNSSLSCANLEEESDEGMPSWEVHARCMMMQPMSLRLLCWEFAGLLFVAYDIIVIPLSLVDTLDHPVTTLMMWLARIFWTFDIPFTFLSGTFTEEGAMEMRPARVARNYVRGRFIFDVFVVLSDWIEAIVTLSCNPECGDADALRLISMLRVARMARLVRLGKSQKFRDIIHEHVRSEGVMLVVYMFLILLTLMTIIHAIACAWYGISSGHEGTLTERYIQSFHRVLALFMGEHIIEAEMVWEHCFVIAVLVLAFVTDAWVVGSLTTAMTRLQIIASRRSTQFASLNRYLADYGISPELKLRVQRNARHALKEQSWNIPETSVELLLLISEPLRTEIHYEVHAPVLTMHPFFRLYNSVNPSGVRHICHNVISQVSLSRGDVVFAELEVPVSPQIYFITRGELSYHQEVSVPERVGQDMWVAEAVLWTTWTHRGTLQVLTDCRMLALDAARFANLMGTFPTQHVVAYAERFVQHLNETGSDDVLTDLGDLEISREAAISAFYDVDGKVDVPWEWSSWGRKRGSSTLEMWKGARRGSLGSLGSISRKSLVF